VHTIGMRFAIDVAFLSDDLRVVAVVTMRPQRIAFPRRGGRSVLEAQAGAFERWGLTPGGLVAIQGSRPNPPAADPATRRGTSRRAPVANRARPRWRASS